MLQQFVAEVAPALVTVLGSILIAALTLLANQLKKKLGKDSQLLALNQLAHLAEASVLALNQTIVNDLRSRAADGVISREDAIEVKDLAIKRVKAALADRGIREIMKALGYSDESQLDEIISTQIEAAVARASSSLVTKVSATIGTTETS